MKSFAAAITIVSATLATPLAFADPASDTASNPAGCAQLAAELPELLASAMQRDRRDGEVDATFDVDESGTVRSITLQGSRQYRSQVRTALESLDCNGGRPQHYALKIRFAEPTPQKTVMAAAQTAVNGHPR